jgi:hypothetical protein
MFNQIYIRIYLTVLKIALVVTMTASPALASSLKTVSLSDLAIANQAGECKLKDSRTLQCSGPLYFRDLHDMVINGGGKRVEFLNTQPGRGGIVLAQATNVTFTNLEIGWAGEDPRSQAPAGVQRLYSFATVSACPIDKSSGVLQADLPIEGVQPVSSVSLWDFKTGWPWMSSSPTTYEVNFPSRVPVVWTAGRSECVPRLSALIGRRVLVRHALYGSHAFNCITCNSVTVENVRVTSSPGMAFVFGNGGSGLTLRNNVVSPGCTPRCAVPTPSAGADGAHFAAVKGDIVVEGNDFGWQGDDGLNITGLMFPARVAGDRPVDGVWLTVDDQWRSRSIMLKTGGTLLLFDDGLSPVGETEILEVKESGHKVRLASLPGGITNYVAVGADFIPRGVVIRRNRFHDSRARGILMGGWDGVIEENEISRVPNEAILLPADTGPWFEGPGARNVIIRNNRITDVDARPPADGLYPAAISLGIALSPQHRGIIGSPINNININQNTFTRIISNPQNLVSRGEGVSQISIGP